MVFHLAVKEVLHSKWRFMMISLIVALITTLVLFIAALTEGLGAGNREYLEKLNGELVAFQANVDLSTAASRIGRSKLSDIRRVAGVEDVGQVATATSSIYLGEDVEPLDVSLIGVEPGRPGEPPVLGGRTLGRSRANEVIIEKRTAELTGLQLGDTLTLKSIQGTAEEFFDLEIVGVSDGRGFFLLPTIFVPYLTWEKVRPQGGDTASNRGDFISNIVAVKLTNSEELNEVAQRLEREVGNIEVVDRKTAYEATPGYTAQQSTLDTQRYFTFVIGILVIGGFFQIQTLQKVAQIGMLKAIGTTTRTIALSAIVQILVVNSFGVLIGTAGSLALSLTFPPMVPIVFTGEAVASAMLALLLVRSFGGDGIGLAASACRTADGAWAGAVGREKSDGEGIRGGQRVQGLRPGQERCAGGGQCIACR